MNTCEELIKQLTAIQRYKYTASQMYASNAEGRYVRIEDVLAVAGNHVAREADRLAESK